MDNGQDIAFSLILGPLGPPRNFASFSIHTFRFYLAAIYGLF